MPQLSTYKRSFFILIISLMEIFTAKAQDPEFTQFYANPLYLNPAFAGSVNCPRIALNYRNQWPSISGTYITSSFSYDQHIENIYGGLGLIVTHDQAGEATLNTSTINMMYSYQFKVNRTFSVRMAGQAGYFQRSLDWSKLAFGDMIDARRGFVFNTNDIPRGGTVGNVDFGAGILGYSDQYYFGFAAHHLTTPNESVIVGNSALPMKFTAHAGAVIVLNKQQYSSDETRISPNILFRAQGTFKQLNLGLYAHKKNLTAGVWYRAKDAFIVLVGIQSKHFRFGYSYDLTASKLTMVTGGSHELSLGYTFHCKPRKRTYRTISCPSF